MMFECFSAHLSSRCYPRPDVELGMAYFSVFWLTGTLCLREMVRILDTSADAQIVTGLAQPSMGFIRLQGFIRYFVCFATLTPEGGRIEISSEIHSLDALGTFDIQYEVEERCYLLPLIAAPIVFGRPRCPWLDSAAMWRRTRDISASREVQL